MYICLSFTILHIMTFHIMLILKQEYIEIERYHAETQSRMGLTGSSWNMSSENMKLQFSNLMNVQNLPSYRPHCVVDKLMQATEGVVL